MNIELPHSTIRANESNMHMNFMFANRVIFLCVTLMLIARDILCVNFVIKEYNYY